MLRPSLAVSSERPNGGAYRRVMRPLRQTSRDPWSSQQNVRQRINGSVRAQVMTRGGQVQKLGDWFHVGTQKLNSCLELARSCEEVVLP